MALTKKQKRFVEEYLVDLNATQAAIRAGYSTQTAYSIGDENLKKPEIKNAIEKALAERSRRTGVNADRVILELAKIAFLNPTDVINMSEATIKGDSNRDDTAAISSVKVKRIPTEDGDITEREVRTYDKIKALELLGKHLGMFTDKFKVEGAIPVVVHDDLDDEDEVE
jgi:phage terminase small subunit